MEIPRSERRPASPALLAAAAAAAAGAGVAILAIDQPVARAVAPYEAHPFWQRGMESLEWVLGWPVHPLLSLFVAVGLLLAVMAVPRWRALAPAAMLLAGTHVFSVYLTAMAKDWFGRIRPTPWLRGGGDGATFFLDGASFPSGHVSLFASVALPIALLVPRARPVLAAIAFVACARVAVQAHFVSDTLGSIALVCAVAWLVALAARPFRRA